MLFTGHYQHKTGDRRAVRLYDGFDPILERKLRAKIRRNVSCYGRFMPHMVAENEGRAHDYMDSEPDINEKMRAILIDWLVQVHGKFELLPETLYLIFRLFIDATVSINY
ncbi:hypothetical protein CASFOL_028209 [Castilleja foliolosa]|uniref:Cyclin N-terminal domain-containing protein n=1 Tax=Castilleja foliolosa TaxID=1961234 RepID=A0ABD3CE18_9LAMI